MPIYGHSLAASCWKDNKQALWRSARSGSDSVSVLVVFLLLLVPPGAARAVAMNDAVVSFGCGVAAAVVWRSHGEFMCMLASK